MRLHVKFHSSWRRKLAPADRRWWLLRAIGFCVEIQRDPVWDFAIYWKRLALALVVLAVAAYLAGVTALHYWWNREVETRVGWSDIALAPLRWDKFREQRGDRMVALGQAKLEQGRFAEAAFDLQAGLARSPGNLAGRLSLARLWAMMSGARALKVVEDGLALSPHEPQLLAALFDLYALSGAETAARERSAALLAAEVQPPLPADARRVVVNGRAALLVEVQPAEALALLDPLPRDAASPAGLRSFRLTLLALRKLGREAEASALFAAMPRDAARDPRSEAELAIAAGNADALETALRRLKASAAHPAEASLFAIRAWHQLKRPILRDAATLEFLRFHGADERTLQGLGALAVELDLPLVLLRAAQEAAERRFNPFAFQVHATELALRRGDIEEARRQLPRWEGVLSELPEAQREIPELFARLVRATAPNSEAHQAALLVHLERGGPRFRPAMFRLVIDTLERAGNLAGATRAAETGTRFFPLHDLLAAEATRLAGLEKKAAEARMAVIAPSARPAPSSDESEDVTFADPAAALGAIDEAIASGRTERALRLIRALRKSAPEWLAETEPALARREFRARRAQGEMPSAMIVFRELALKPGLPRTAAFQLVRELIAEGEGESALQLAREIVRLVPGERAATVLLKEAEAAAPAPGETALGEPEKN